MLKNKLISAVSLFVRWLLFPLFIVTTVTTMAMVQSTDISPLHIQMALFFSAIIIVEIAERGFRSGERRSDKETSDGRLNFTSMVVLMAVVDPILKFVTPLAFSALILTFGVPEGFAWFPAQWPFVAQLIAAAIIAEFGQYWLHRLGHVSVLWRFHAAHHSSWRMNWMTGFRAHPINMVYHHFAGMFVLILIGVPEFVLISYLALFGVVNVFRHANVPFKNGLLNYVFSTNELHRWHHSTVQTEANANYGEVLVVWDLVFGSYYNSEGKEPKYLGLFASDNYPSNSYIRQLIAPVMWKKWRIGR